MSDAMETSAPVEADPSTRSIAEAVDGPGAEMQIIQGGAEEAPKAKPAPEPTAPTEVDTPAETEIDPIAEAEKWLVDPEAEASSDVDEDDDDLGEDEEGGRASRTIRNLRRRAQEAEQLAQSNNQRFEEFQRQTYHQQQQWQNWAQEQQQQTQHLREELIRLSAGAPQGEAPLDPSDPDYELKKFERQQREHWRSDFEERAKPLMDELAQLKEQRRQEQEYARQQQISNRYTHEANRSADYLTSTFEPESADKLRGPIGTMIMNVAYGYKTDIESASRVWDRIACDYAMAKMRSRAAASKAKVAQSQQTATAGMVGRGAAGARGQPMVSEQDARAKGYRDSLDMMFQSDGFKMAPGAP